MQRDVLLTMPKVMKHRGTFRLSIPEVKISSGLILLKGPNGSGKSTFFREVIDVCRKSKAVSIGFLPQKCDDAILGWRTSLQNLTDFGIPSTEAVHFLQQISFPSSCLNIRPRQLSGGQRQLLLLARELLLQPDILLLDEPFSSLDAHVVQKAALEINRLLFNCPRAVILASHVCAETLVAPYLSLCLQRADNNVSEVLQS